MLSFLNPFKSYDLLPFVRKNHHTLIKFYCDIDQTDKKEVKLYKKQVKKALSFLKKNKPYTHKKMPFLKVLYSRAVDSHCHSKKDFYFDVINNKTFKDITENLDHYMCFIVENTSISQIDSFFNPLWTISMGRYRMELIRQGRYINNKIDDWMEDSNNLDVETFDSIPFCENLDYWSEEKCSHFAVDENKECLQCETKKKIKDKDFKKYFKAFEKYLMTLTPDTGK